MTSALTSAREGLETALGAAGLRVVEPSAKVSTPCVFVVPGDPWLRPSRLSAKIRIAQYRLIGLVGLKSAAAQQANTEAMAQQLADAVAATSSPPWTLVSIEPVATYEVGGQTYLAVIGETQTPVAGGS
jgi:hypothetical protein